MLNADTQARLVLITAPDLEAASRLGRSFVAAELAACVNVVPGVRSIYRWEGAVCEEGEVLLVVKTTVASLAALEALNAAEHPYDCPEFVVVQPEALSADYGTWLEGAVRG